MKPWNRFEQYFKHRLLRGAERWFGVPHLALDAFDADQVNSILIVRQHDQLGDFLLSTPVFKAVRRRFPGARIAVVARTYTAALVEHHDCIDEVIPFYEHGGHWTWEALKKLFYMVRHKYDLGIVLNTVSHSLTSDLIARFGTRRYILGSEHQLFTGTQRNFFYHLTSPYASGKRHQTHRNLDIIRYIGIEPVDEREYLRLLPQEKEQAHASLLALGRDPAKPLVLIHPGAGKADNRWPVAAFANVGRRLNEELGAQVLVMWGPKEAELGRELLAALPFAALRVTHHDLRRIAAIMNQTDLVLCNDTGVMHLAAAVGTPLVAVFGPTDPLLWKPLGDSFRALRAPDESCASVDPDKVYLEAKKLLNRS